MQKGMLQKVLLCSAFLAVYFAYAFLLVVFAK
jgi:hypothetical protein